MAVLVALSISYIIHKELFHYIKIRNFYLTTAEHRRAESANTILIRDIPRQDLQRLSEIYSVFPGGVRSVWINRDLTMILQKIRYQRKLVDQLEAAETRLAQSVMMSHHRQPNAQRQTRKGTRWEEFLKQENRDHTYLPSRKWCWTPGFLHIGKKVDTIDYTIHELSRLHADLERDYKELDILDQQPSDRYPLTQSAFIEFNDQLTAHMVSQTLLRSHPLQCTVQCVDVPVQDIRWDCLADLWWVRWARTTCVWVVIICLLLVWAVPVALTGILSQVTTLGDSIRWLAWIVQGPSWLRGLIQGVMPQLILTVLTVLLPEILRFITAQQCFSTNTAIELSLQRIYFAFLFIQTFLTVSLSSSITAIVQDMYHSLDSAPALIAQNLPKASNYFFSYLILQGLSVSAATLLQALGLLKWFLLGPFDRTPRQKWARYTDLPLIQWGTLFPFYANLACIGMIFVHPS